MPTDRPPRPDELTADDHRVRIIAGLRTAVPRHVRLAYVHLTVAEMAGLDELYEWRPILERAARRWAELSDAARAPQLE